MLEVAFWAQNQCSYDRARELLEREQHIKLNCETIRLVADFVGSLVFNEERRIAEIDYERLNTGKLEFSNDVSGVLYIETDGSALNTRTKDENGSTWRENKLGEVFSSDNIRYWTDKKGKRQHRIEKKEYISLVGPASDFKKHLFSCALRGGYGKYRETVLLSDGAAWIRSMKQEIFPDAQHILDFYHLCENVNEFAKHLFKFDESKYVSWAADICTALKASETKRVIAELATFSNSNLKNCSVNLYLYIQNNINNIDYADYIAKGYFVGSGSIESGNKIVLQQRLKQSGMRWNVTTAQSLLTLKAKQESGLWERDVVSLLLRQIR